MIRSMPFQLRLLLGLLVIFLVPVTVMLVLNLTYLRKAQIRHSSTSLLSDARARSSLLEEEIRSGVNQVILLSKKNSIEDSLGPQATTESLDNQVLRSLLRNFLVLSEGRFDEIRLINYKGQELLRVLHQDGETTLITQGLENLSQSPIFTQATLNASNDPAEVKASVYDEYLEPGYHTGNLWISKQLEGSETGINGVIAVRMSREPILNTMKNLLSTSESLVNTPEKSSNRYSFQHISLIDDEGKVIFTNRPDIEPGTPLQSYHPTDASIIMQHEAGALVDTQDAPNMIQTFSKINPQGIGNIQWHILYEHPIENMVQEADQSTWFLLLTSIIAMLLAILMMYLLIRQTIAPLNRLSLAVSNLAMGKWDTRLPELKARDEISTLTSAFNTMTSQLSTSYRDLEETIDELRKSQAQLNEHRQLLETVIDSAMARIFVKTPEGRYLLIRAPGVVDGHPEDNWDKSVFSGDQLQRVKTHDKQVLETGESVASEDIVRQGNAEHTFLTISFPIRNEDNEIYAIGGISMDITERKEAERILQRSHDELEELVASRTQALEETQRELVRVAHRAGMSEVADNVIHNIGNILNSIQSSIYMLEQQISRRDDLNTIRQFSELLHEYDSMTHFVSEDERAEMLPAFIDELMKAIQRHFDQMQEQVDNTREKMSHITNIINEQKNYASGTLLIEEAKVTEFLDDAIEMARYRLENIQIQRDDQADMDWPIQRHRFMQVIVNILINAADAMVAQSQNKIIHLSSAVDGQHLVITIQDEGPGIPPDLHDLIFTSGFTTKQAGSGIGLHYSAVSVQSMGGEILLLDSDRGACFEIRIPRPTRVDTTTSEQKGLSIKAGLNRPG